MPGSYVQEASRLVARGFSGLPGTVQNSQWNPRRSTLGSRDRDANRTLHRFERNYGETHGNEFNV